MTAFSDGDSQGVSSLISPCHGSGSPHRVGKVEVEWEGWKPFVCAWWWIQRKILQLLWREDALTPEFWGIHPALKVSGTAKSCKQPGAFKSTISPPPSQEAWPRWYFGRNGAAFISHTKGLGSLTFGMWPEPVGMGTRTFPVVCAEFGTLWWVSGSTADGEAVPGCVCKAEAGLEFTPSVAEAGIVLPMSFNARDFTPSWAVLVHFPTNSRSLCRTAVPRESILLCPGWTHTPGQPGRWVSWSNPAGISQIPLWSQPIFDTPTVLTLRDSQQPSLLLLSAARPCKQHRNVRILFKTATYFRTVSLYSPCQGPKAGTPG